MSEETALGGDIGGQGSGTNTTGNVDAANTGTSTTGDEGNASQAGSYDGGAGGSPAEGLPQWLSGIEGLDSEYSGDTSLKAIQDIPSLVKSYVHAQRKMGADKTVIPNQNSTNEEWMQFYGKLGLPTEFDKYDIQMGEESIVKEDFFNAFKQEAYDNKMLPDQAQKMFDFFSNRTKNAVDEQQASQQEESANRLNGLKEEWGDAFDQNVFKAKAAVNEFGGEDLKAYLNESGLGNDPNLIKAFAKIGDSFLKEDNFSEAGKPAYAMSPSEAMEKANGIMGDLNGPYYNSMHPDHRRIVDEVSKLFQVGAAKQA
jgi:hypothetical protein